MTQLVDKTVTSMVVEGPTTAVDKFVQDYTSICKTYKVEISIISVQDGCKFVELTQTKL